MRRDSAWKLSVVTSRRACMRIMLTTIARWFFTRCCNSRSIDTALFFSIAFAGNLSFLHPATDVSWAAETLPLLGAGPMAPLWVSLAVADWAVKLSIALVALIPFRLITARLTERA